MHRITLTRAIAAVSTIVLLSACASLPLPYDVDLGDKLPQTSTDGVVSEPVQEGEVEELHLRFPSEAGECFAFHDVAPGVTVRSAKLKWIVDVTYDGPELTGKLQGRAYATGVGDEVFDPSNTLGPLVTVKLDRTSTRFEGMAELNPEQLQAVNEREVCWGAAVEGEDVAALEDGTITVDYSVKKLMLHITFSVF